VVFNHHPQLKHIHATHHPILIQIMQLESQPFLLVIILCQEFINAVVKGGESDFGAGEFEGF
jgi:hypothetical protein